MNVRKVRVSLWLYSIILLMVVCIASSVFAQDETVSGNLFVTDNVGIGTAPNSQRQLYINTTRRWGADVKVLSSSAAPIFGLATRVEGTSSGGPTGASYTVIGSGTTPFYEGMTGLGLSAYYTKTADEPTGIAAGYQNILVNVHSNIQHRIESTVGNQIVVGTGNLSGYGSGGSATQLIANTFGIHSSFTNDSFDKGTNSMKSSWENVSHYYAKNLLNVDGILSGEQSSRMTITNYRGINIEDLTRGTNNTNILIGTGTTGNWSIYNNSPYNNYFAGNVGIGTAEPTTKLTVNGSIALSQPNGISFGIIGEPKYNALQVDNNGDIVIGGGGETPWQNIRFFAAAAEKVTINGNGNVGIGTTSPDSPLHIVQNGSNSANRNLIISQHINANQASLLAFRRSRGTDGSPIALQNGDNVAWFDARPYDGNEYLFDAAHMEFIVSGAVSSNNVPMDFRIITGSSKQNYVPDFIIKNNGNVGIGTEAPQALLHVAGDIKVDGNIAAKYQDLAEWVKTSKPLSSGTVVIIDAAKVNEVVPSDSSYNTLVAGVVSETPGIILGEGGEGKAIIAHTGRVKVKVDTNYGVISTGDLLVTSPVQGYAMKADTDKLKPGMLLGKALEPLKEGQQGEILALITLQ